MPSGPLIVTGTVQIKRAGATVGTPMPAHIEPPSTEQIAADGGQLYWEIETPPGAIPGTSPASYVRQNDLMIVVTCPSNPAIIPASAMGWSISAVRQPGGLIPKTMFRALQKVQ